MSSLMRSGALACIASFALLGNVPTAPAQEKKGDGPAGQKPVNVFNIVEGRTTILTIKPEGTRVKKGEVVCELDSSDLKDQVAHQESATRAAEIAGRGAKMAREVAEMALTEYKEQGYKVEWQTVLGEIARCEANRSRAEDRLDDLRRIASKNGTSEKSLIAEKYELDVTIFAFEMALSKKTQLEKHSKDRMIKNLKCEIEMAKAKELAMNAAYEREKANAKKLMKHVEACKVIAPADGRLGHAPSVEAGVPVRDGQPLFHIIAEDQPAAEAK